MNFGIVHETRLNEKRVALTPGGAATLVRAGHTVYLESGAGLACGWTDQDYQNQGVQIVFNHEEIYGRAEILLKILPVVAENLAYIHTGQTIISFQHLAIASPEVYHGLVKKKVNLIGMEIIEDDDGSRPILRGMSEIAGQLAPIIAGNYLGRDPMGKGVLLGGVAGVSPASVVILGAGTSGLNAACAFSGLGAQVHVLDRNLDKLREVRKRLGNQVATLFADENNITKTLKFADVFMGAVLIRGSLTPHILKRSMIAAMKPLSIFIDFSIDEGGISETSRPTTLSDPIYLEEGVIHYCVPNITAGVNRTASRALANMLVDVLQTIGELGTKKALNKNPALRRGTYLLDGECLIPALKDHFTHK
ncbi:MAG: alanine dehydrogenase [Candidatus Marinimicrobia bacterium]|nr:alanine dehydrogenase [Candidatus Neomarinimicrobiota bacterium]MCF7839460.1 alanine dehydrogenase [Candidatus Neomarinimicrobiota bacterium]MCF7901864.1 alanine dehydrogenase [Candidatus Neomarinimicrobiota bacterium]